MCFFQVVLEKIADLEAENMELKTKLSYIEGNCSGAEVTLTGIKWIHNSGLLFLVINLDHWILRLDLCLYK